MEKGCNWGYKVIIWLADVRFIGLVSSPPFAHALSLSLLRCCYYYFFSVYHWAHAQYACFLIPLNTQTTSMENKMPSVIFQCVCSSLPNQTNTTGDLSCSAYICGDSAQTNKNKTKKKASKENKRLRRNWTIEYQVMLLFYCHAHGDDYTINCEFIHWLCHL